MIKKMTRLRYERLKRNMTLSDVEKETGIDKNNLCRYEIRVRGMKLKTYRLLEKFYNVDPHKDLLDVLEVEIPEKQGSGDL